MKKLLISVLATLCVVGTAQARPTLPKEESKSVWATAHCGEFKYTGLMSRSDYNLLEKGLKHRTVAIDAINSKFFVPVERCVIVVDLDLTGEPK